MIRVPDLGARAAALPTLTALAWVALAGLAPTADAQVATTPALVNGLRARQIGPAVMSGRCTSIAVAPGDAKTVYIGTASGGLWKSTSGGTTVRPVFDEHTMSIGKVAVAPSDARVVYVGTGEPWTRNTVSVGTGVYRSDDAGASWRAVGLDSTERIGDLLVHPDDPNTVYVAALGHLWDPNPQRGVYKSTDGGATWTRSLYLDEDTGASGLSFDPVDPEIVYATMWGFRRRPWDFDSGYGGRSGLYRSTDGGATWTELRGAGFPAGKLGRIDVEVAPTNRDVLYASVECEDKSARGLYRSRDRGATWTHVSDDFGTTVRPFYFSNVVVSPHSDSTVAKAGLNAILSEDAGHTMRILDRAMHSDIHDLWFDPANADHLLVATDGGVYESFDGGETTRMWMNLPVSQFYHVSVDREEPYNVYGGLQDNGSWVGPSRRAGGIGNDDWTNTYGGDGFYSFRHPERDDIVYSEYQGGNLVRFNATTGQAKAIAPYADAGAEKLRWNWNSPLVQSAHAPDRIYFGAQYLFRSDDTGDSWRRVSGDLTTDDPAKQQQSESGGLSVDNSTAENHTTIYTIAESPLSPAVLWVGTDDGNIQHSGNGGDDWALTHQDPDYFVTDIEASPHDAAVAYATLDGHRVGRMAPRLLRTGDAGRTWEPVALDGVEGYALCVRQDLVNPDLLFLGTEFGLYVSLDAGASWARLSNNLPRVAVRDMVIHPDAGSLVLATHGRGIAIVDDLAPWRQLTPAMTGEKVAFFALPPTVLRDPGAGGNWFGGSAGFTGPNPSTSAQIAYHAAKRHTFGRMYLEVWRGGVKLRTLPAGKAAGLNVVDMPTARSKPKSAPSDNRQALVGSLFGPNLAAGTYDVLLVKGRDTFATTFELAYDEASPYTAAAREAQLATATELYDMSERLAYVYATMESVGASAKTYDAPPAARRLLDTLARATERFRDRITFTGGDFYVDEGERIREEISNLYFKVVQYPGAPSSEQVSEAARLAAELSRVEADQAELLAELLTPTNAVLAEAGLPQIDYPARAEFLAGETGGGSAGGYGQWYRMERGAGYDALTGTALGTRWALPLLR